MARAVNFGFFVILIGVSVFNIRAAFAIPGFERTFQDMLGNRPLPMLTQCVLRFHLPLCVSSIAIPTGALAFFFLQPTEKSVAATGVLLLVAMVQAVLILYALFSPLAAVIGSWLSPA